MRSHHAALIWIALVLIIAVPIGAAVSSPLLAWRRPVYIIAGFAGIFALVLILLQPLLVTGYLPGFPGFRGRRAHHVVGAVLVLAVIVHVGGLWITSPPDVIDALLFVSPTAFSAWGVFAMWAVFAAASMAAFRRRLPLRPKTWRMGHATLASVISSTSVAHSLLIEGTMEPLSKAALCVFVLAALLAALIAVRSRANRTMSR